MQDPYFKQLAVVEGSRVSVCRINYSLEAPHAVKAKPINPKPLNP